MKQLLLILMVAGTSLLAPRLLTAAPTTRILNNNIPASPDGERFLFVVDTSSDMADLQTATENSIYEILRNGVGGHMRSGDTFGMWTFNKTTTAGRFPLQIWDSRKSTQQGTIAASYLNDLTFEKTSNTKELVENLYQVVRVVSNLTILIYSDGALMRGTPFDKEINEGYKKERSARRQLKRPYVTSLIARDGRIISAHVNVAGQALSLPDRLALAAPEIVATPARAPGASNKVATARPPAATANPARSTGPTPSPATASQATALSAPAPGPAPAPAPAGASPIVAAEAPRPKVVQIVTLTNSTPSPEPPALTVAASTETFAPEATAGAPGSAQVAQAALRHASNALTAVVPGAPLAPTPTAPPSVPAIRTAPPGQSLLHSLSPEPMPVAAREPDSGTPDAGMANAASPTPLLATAHPAASGGSILIWMAVFGGVLMVLTLGLLVVVLRRGRAPTHGSFITQSMERR